LTCRFICMCGKLTFITSSTMDTAVINHKFIDSILNSLEGRG
jgi:hypothetical protein